MKKAFIVSWGFLFSLVTNAAAPQFNDYGDESTPTYTAASRLWVKSELRNSSVEGLGGEVKSQAFVRYANFPVPFKIGVITYYSLPKSNPKWDNIKTVKERFQKALNLPNLIERKWENDTWVLETPYRKGPRYMRVYFTESKDRFAVSTAVLRNAYVESTFIESEWIQQRIVERERSFYSKNKQVYTFPSLFKMLELFPEAYAQGQPQNCPPIPGTTPAGVGSGTCPSPASCSGLFPTAQATCLANVSACNQAQASSAINNASGAVTGAANTINCQGNAWGDRLASTQQWLDAKSDKFSGQIDEALHIAGLLADPVHMSVVAGLSAVTASLATGAMGLLITGVTEGVSALWKEVSGQNAQERLKKQAEAFESAMKEWKELNKDLEEVEKAIDNSIEIFELAKASGLSFEEYLGQMQKDIDAKKYQMKVAGRKYEAHQRCADLQAEFLLATEHGDAASAKSIKDKIDSTCAVQKLEGDFAACAADNLTAQNGLEQEVESLQKMLDTMKPKKSYKSICQNLSQGIGELLAKESALEKARQNLSMYYAAHLRVQQQELAARIEDRNATNPEENYKNAMKAAEDSFINSLGVGVHIKDGKYLNCKKALVKFAEECQDENTAWYQKIPLISPASGGLKWAKKCGVSPAHAHANPQVANTSARLLDAKSKFGYLLGVYGRKLASKGELKSHTPDDAHARCVTDAINAYQLYERRVAQEKRTLDVARATWNYRRQSFAPADSAYHDQLSEMIRQLDTESACLGGMESDDCKESSLRLVCANQSGKCPKVSESCKVMGEADACKYEAEGIKRCQDLIQNCKAENHPIGCEEAQESFCESGRCYKLEEECYSIQDEKKRKKTCDKAVACRKEEKACLDKKAGCIKSAYSSTKFRFGRFKLMRDYLDKHLCDFPKKPKGKASKQ